MSGYSSDLNLRLGQMPEIKDNPAIFSELQRIYNSLHLLNASLNDVRRNFADVDRDTPPWESFTFEGRSFWAPAADNVAQGDLVTMEGNQFVPGIKGSTSATSTGEFRCVGPGRGRPVRRDSSTVSGYDFGFCLEETSDGLAHIGWPAAIVEVSGIPVGELAYGRQGDGRVFSNAPDSSFYPVGRIVAPDALLLQHHMTITTRTRVTGSGGCG